MDKDFYDKIRGIVQNHGVTPDQLKRAKAHIDSGKAKDLQSAMGHVRAEDAKSDDFGAKIRSTLQAHGVTQEHLDHAKEAIRSGRAKDFGEALHQARDHFAKKSAASSSAAANAAQPQAVQTGAKGGSYYVTATGRKVYTKK